MSTNDVPLAAVLCVDLARGYRTPVEIARINRCTEHEVYVIRRLFGPSRETLLRAARLLTDGSEPEPVEPSGPLADCQAAHAAVAAALEARDRALQVAHDEGHTRRDIAAAVGMSPAWVSLHMGRRP